MFIVTEIQTYTDGTVGTIVNSYESQQQAESRYHTVLAAAAVSNLPKHAVILFTEEGFPMLYQCYRHAVTVQPDQTPEPTEPGENEAEP